MNQAVDPSLLKRAHDDVDHNTSGNTAFQAVLDARLSRRSILRGGVGSAATALFGSLAVAACGGGDDDPANAQEKLLGFSAVSKSLSNSVVVPTGYTATTLYALGDPLRAATAAYKNDGTDTDFENRAGDHHDGMEWFGLSAGGQPSATSVDRGLLAVNHEATTDELRSSFFLHANGGTTTLPRPGAEVDKETAIHGISVVEVAKAGSTINAKTSASIDGSDDYRNEINGMGYVVEVDAYDKTRLAKKRTALGRFAHESAAFGKPVVGQPLALYMGDDSRNESIYKWVSAAIWNAADADATNRMAVGDKYLDTGKLYVAKFAADGTGQWLEVSFTNPVVAAITTYPFADQADVSVHSRIAADALGATKMDRPEWCGVNPSNGEIYFTLTNNSNRRVEPAAGGAQLAPDSANPRVYTDIRGASTSQVGNPNGHILRMKEGAAGSAATAFTWDVYLFGAESSASPGAVNLSSLTADQDFSSPDGLVFSPYTGICWVQTDDGAYTDVTNCMMLAALPGQVGDGKKLTLSYPRTAGVAALAVDTYVGKLPTADTLKRFLVGPVGCEITGLCETPDGKAMFINIQHPGENTAQAVIADPTRYTSQWPSNAGYGAGKRPRSATILITKNDGGRIGS